jgi:hypothetical protein
MTWETIQLQRSPSTPWRRVADSILLAPPGREDFDQLSGPAATTWLLLEEPHTLEELVTMLGNLYGTDPGMISTDVSELIEKLISRGSVVKRRW